MGSEDRAASPIHRQCIADASAMHWRHRRCIGDVGVEKIGLRIEAARPSDTSYSDPIWEA